MIRCQLCGTLAGQGELFDHLRLFHPAVFEDLMGFPPAGDAPAGTPVFPVAGEPLACMGCGTAIGAGQRYATKLTGMAGPVFITEMVCLRCGGES